MDLKKLILIISTLSYITSDEPSVEYINACAKTQIAPADEDECIRSDIINDTTDCCYVAYTDDQDKTVKQCRIVNKGDSNTNSVNNLKLELESEDTKLKEGTSYNITCPKFGVINNNCGIVGHGEPFKKEHCSTVKIAEKYCCLLTFKVPGDTETHHACRLVEEYIDKGKTTKESRNLIEDLYEGAILESGMCSSVFKKYSFYLLIITLGLLFY